MRPVVAYRHKLRWKLWRVWQAMRRWVGQLASWTMLVGIVVIALAVSAAMVFGPILVAPRRYEDSIGRVVATGPVNGARQAPFALIRVGADVVRFETPSLADCQVGDYVDVRKTFTRERFRRPTVYLGAEPTSPCRSHP